MPDVEKSGKEHNWLDEVLGDISKTSATKQLVLGTASGWLTGYMTLKVGKVVALAIGGSIIVLQIANHKGYIKINWDKINKVTDKVVDAIEKETTGQAPSSMDKMERYMDRQLNKAERLIKKVDKKQRGWFDTLLNNQDERYNLQELHIFMLSYVAGIAFGFATA